MIILELITIGTIVISGIKIHKRPNAPDDNYIIHYVLIHNILFEIRLDSLIKFYDKMLQNCSRCH